MGCIPLHPPRMANVTNSYGSREYYMDCFMDVLGDEADQDIDNVIDGFMMALEDLLAYHSKQSDAYRDIHLRVRQTLGM